MQDKTVVVTGATSGIGQVAAEALARKGARILFVARDRGRGDATLSRLNGIAPGLSHAVYYGDLSRLGDMKRVASEITADAPRIDVLINNAGAVFGERKLTQDGIDQTFATNHLAYFVTTNLLLPSLKAAGNARIVSTASSAHSSSPAINRMDVQTAGVKSAPMLYGLSKLYNILFTRELARRLTGTSVTANCVHPGVVRTRFADEAGGWFTVVFGIVKQLAAVTPEKGAETIIYLASSPEVAGASGGYYAKCRPHKTSAQANDAEAAKWLWEESAKLTGVTS